MFTVKKETYSREVSLFFFFWDVKIIILIHEFKIEENADCSFYKKREEKLQTLLTKAN